MKIILVLSLFAAVSTAYETFDLGLLGNSLDDLMREGLEYIRFLLKKHDPYNLPPLIDQSLVDKDVNIVFSAENVQWSKAGDFTIDKLSNNLPQLNASFQISSPTEYFHGNYKISGTGFGKAVKGEGSFKVEVHQFVQYGNVQFGIIDHSLQVVDFKVDFSIGKIKAYVDGMTVEGMSAEQIRDFFNNQILAFLNNNKASICEDVAGHVKDIANKAMEGKTLAEVLDFVRKLVASTPDPPPFENVDTDYY